MAEYTDYTAGEGEWTADFTGNALIFIWGGGGGGGGGVGLLRGGGGGGGGAFTVSIVPVVQNTTYFYTIGSGGSGGAFGGNSGGDGGASAWSFGAELVIATGGKGGGAQGGAGGHGNDGIGDSRTNGFPGLAATGYVGGAGGKAGGAGGGAGGPAPSTQHAGIPGSSPGGGGSGGGQLSSGSGAAGAAGGLVVSQAPDIEPGSYLVGVDYDGFYDDPGTYEWTSPGNGIAIVQCVGSGGGGRGGVALLLQGGAGGGGGAYALKAVSVVEDTVYERVVPSGGSGSVYNNGSTTDGAPAIFRVKAGAELVKADGGKRSTGSLSGAGAGGAAGSSIGDTTTSGDNGTNSTGSSTNGGAGGGGALPLGGAGGGGGDNAQVSGRPGSVPGGGGGGGRGQTNGHGAAGARGAVVIAYFVTYGSVIIGGEEKFIVRIRYKDENGMVHNVNKPSRIENGVRKSIVKVLPELTMTERPKPSYIPSGHEAKFNATNGTFNWAAGASHVADAILGGAFQFIQFGDSVSEGWTYLNNLPPFNYNADFPNAFPRWARNYISEDTGLRLGGSGMVRPHSVGGGDPAWTKSGWGTGGTHFLNSTSGNQSATFTSREAGTAVAVATSSYPCDVYVDNVHVGVTPLSATNTVVRTVFTGFAPTTHVVRVVSQQAGSGLYGADVYFPDDGVRVHNLAQGGSRAAFGSASSPTQEVWSDTAPGAPNAMLPLYSQQTGMFGKDMDACVIMLGGNDSFQDINAANIAAAHGIIGNAMHTANTDVILMPNVHSEDRMAALMQLCINEDWAMVDFFWLSRNLATVFGQGYNGDIYGHLNVDGAKWCGRLLANALLTGVND